MRSKFHKSKANIILAASTVALLVGCSSAEYPTEGKLNTDEVTQRTEVVDVRGHIYGINEGASDLIKAIYADGQAIGKFERQTWDALVAGESENLPALSLSYPLESASFDADAFRSGTIENMKADIAQAKEEAEGDQLAPALEDAFNSGRSEEMSAAYSNYFDAMEADLYSNVKQDTPVTFAPDQETATFEGISGGYEMVAFVGTIIAERNGTRRPAGAIALVDLTDPVVRKADEIVFTIDRDAVREGDRVDMDDTREIQEKLTRFAADAI